MKKIEVIPLDISRFHLESSLLLRVKPENYPDGTLSLLKGRIAELVTLELMALFLRPARLRLNRLASCCLKTPFRFVVVVLRSHVQLFVTPWTAAYQAPLSFTISWGLLKLISTELMMPSKYIILCRPFSPCPQFSHRVFSSESALSIRWPKYWSFSISPSNEYLGLISFRINWFGLLPVQGSLKCLLQHHSSKASILHHSAFFMVQLSHPYMTTQMEL